MSNFEGLDHFQDAVMTRLNDIQLDLIKLKAQMNCLLAATPHALATYSAGTQFIYPVYNKGETDE